MENSFPVSVEGIQRTGPGRKRKFVWDYFEFQPKLNKSVCVVVTETGVVCGRGLAGKNPTNLKTHLRTKHRKVFLKMLEREREAASGWPIRQDFFQQDFEESQSLEVAVSDGVQWPLDSPDHERRESALAYMLLYTGIPTSVLTDPSFQDFCFTLDPKFQLPGPERVNEVISNQINETKILITSLCMLPRRITVSVDVWSDEAKSKSFLGISTCFFDPRHCKVQNVFLDLHVVNETRLGEDLLTQKLLSTLNKWELDHRRVTAVVTDGRTNMTDDPPSTVPKEDTVFDHETPADGLYYSGEDDANENCVLKLSSEEDFRVCHLRCPSYRLRTVLGVLREHECHLAVVRKAVSLVRRIVGSRLAVQKLMNANAKVLIEDPIVTWENALVLVKRLSRTRIEVNQVVLELGWDGLSSGDWARLEELTRLFQPFLKRSKVTQKECLPLSNLVPAVLDLECHLVEQCSNARLKPLAEAMLASLKKCFHKILHPSGHVEALPAAATLLDPTLISVLLVPDRADLLAAAKCFIKEEAKKDWDPLAEEAACSSSTVVKLETDQQRLAEQSPLQRKFKHLAKSLNCTGSSEAAYHRLYENIEHELQKYVLECKETGFAELEGENSALTFWLDKAQLYPKLGHLGQDLAVASVCQSYSDRIYSVWKDLTSNERPGSAVPLDTQIFLKLNQQFMRQFSL